MTGTTKPTDKQADCIADGMVDDVGVDRLQEYGLLDDNLKIDDKADPQDMKPDDADALAGVFVDCIDVQQMFATQLGSGTDELPAAQQKCITDAIDEDAMKAGLSASFQGKQDAGFAAMQKKMTDCVMGTPGTGSGQG